MSVVSQQQLEPEVYKTRKDENFVEYFKIDRRDGGREVLVKVGREGGMNAEKVNKTLK